MWLVFRWPEKVVPVSRMCSEEVTRIHPHCKCRMHKLYKFLNANEGIKDTANQEGYTYIYLLQKEFD